MSDFLLCTDSGCDLSLEVCREKDIIPLKMKYTIGDEVFTDGMTVEDVKGLYQKMREGAAPKTAQINAAEFVDFWTPLLEQHKPILHVAMGSGISGTYANAMNARDMVLEEHPEAEILVLDSLLASYGYGMLCLEISRMRAEGKTLQECYDWGLEQRHLINTYYTASELKYLYRGGRVSRAGAIVGTVLNINPILKLDKEGHLLVIDKVRGEKATERKLHDYIREIAVKPEEQTLYICHSDVPEKAKRYGDAAKAEFGFKDVSYTYIGSTIGCHTGPGLVAFFFYGKPRT